MWRILTWNVGALMGVYWLICIVTIPREVKGFGLTAIRSYWIIAETQPH